MFFSYEQVRDGVQYDPMGFVQECESAFADKIDAVAEQIAEHRRLSPLVLLSGPSASGKTTTAMRIRAKLEEKGVASHTISLDDYFYTIDPENLPRTPEGELDYESPLRLDFPLLHQHFRQLEQGESILVPKFDFVQKARDMSRAMPLSLGQDEVVIFEGIHALNPLLTENTPNALKLAINANTDTVDAEGRVRFSGAWLRLARRLVRDFQFRASDANFTLSLWPSVCRGERLYITPYLPLADIRFDSALPYEVCLLKPYAEALLSSVTQEGTVAELCNAYADFPVLPASYLQEHALLREFIGGSGFAY